MNFLTHNSLVQVGGALAASATHDDNTSVVDRAGGNEGVVFLTTVVSSVAGATAALTVEGADTPNDVDMAPVLDADQNAAAASALSVAANDLAGKLLVVEISKPQHRYLQAVRTSAGGTVAFGDIVALRYSGRSKPPTVDASVAAQNLVVADR